MTEACSLPMSVVASILQDLQVKGIFDINFQQQFADSVKSHMQHLGFMWTDDTLFRETFCQSSVFERCLSSIAIEHLLSNFMSNKLKLNQPVRRDISSKWETISVECDVQDKTCQFHCVQILVTLRSHIYGQAVIRLRLMIGKLEISETEQFGRTE